MKIITKKITLSLLGITIILVITSLVIINLKFDNPLCLDNLDIRCKIKNDYMVKHIQKANFGGQVFCAHTVMGSDQAGEVITEYLWAFCSEYIVENDELKQESGSRPPVVLTIESIKNSYLVFKHELPGDGSMYMEDIKRMFSKYILERKLFFVPSIFDRADSRKIISRLINESKRKAQIHFGLE